MLKLELINIEWNHYNGFIITVLSVEHEKFEGALLSLNASRDFLLGYFLFIPFTIFDRT